MKRRNYFALALFLLTCCWTGRIYAQKQGWQAIDTGLELREFTVSLSPNPGYAKLFVIKINPTHYSFKIYCAKELHIPSMTAKDWCEKYGLIAAVNAGMFQQNYVSHVGYLKNYTHINSARINTQYLSVFACNPTRPSLPLAKIFDIDSTKMETIIADYHTVIQNLRLIKRPSINVWPQQSRKWSEVALAEDKNGNILFLFCKTALSMHDFNEILLKLPIDILCAQHLEGGPTASLYFSHKRTTLNLAGGFETLFNSQKNPNTIQTDSTETTSALPMPNIIGFVEK